MSGMRRHVPNFIDKYLLVWYKKYPSKSEIPTAVNEVMMKKLRDKARVHGSLLMIVCGIFVAIGSIASGKRAAKRGESIEKMNEEFHRNYRLKHTDTKKD